MSKYSEEDLARTNIAMKNWKLRPHLSLVSWSDSEAYRVYLVTWNLMGSVPPASQLDQVLPPDLKADIIIISTQQCQRSLLMSFFCEGKQQWEEMLSDHLKVCGMVNLQSKVLQGLHSVVFVNRELSGKVGVVSTMSKKVGCYGCTGNKGGIQIVLSVGDKTLSIINVHLQHGQKAYNTRMEQMQSIIQQVASEVDFRVVMGDFNFRVDLSLEDAAKSLQNKMFTQLLSHDETHRFFNILKRQGYFQGKVDFPPSYKMSLQDQTYVPSRVPSWTDRIFLKESKNMRQLSYGMSPCLGSDHRAVVSQVQLSIGRSKGVPVMVRESGSKCAIF